MSKLQNSDFKTESDLTGAGGAKSDLLNDDKIYVTGSSINETLDDAITNNQIDSGIYKFIGSGPKCAYTDLSDAISNGSSGEIWYIEDTITETSGVSTALDLSAISYIKIIMAPSAYILLKATTNIVTGIKFGDGATTENFQIAVSGSSGNITCTNIVEIDGDMNYHSNFRAWASTNYVALPVPSYNYATVTYGYTINSGKEGNYIRGFANDTTLLPAAPSISTALQDNSGVTNNDIIIRAIT